MTEFFAIAGGSMRTLEQNILDKVFTKLDSVLMKEGGKKSVSTDFVKIEKKFESLIFLFSANDCVLVGKKQTYVALRGFWGAEVLFFQVVLDWRGHYS